MLNADTKRKIDGLRDLLVGMIPSPQGQVEQITLAMIYKFMSDIDDSNMGVFKNASFFEGNYKQYKRTYIMDPKLSAQDRLHLYAKGLEKMNQNPKIPSLFRQIFKHAFLPHRNPTVLDRFLKQISEFEYEHSEDLGDAYEYLLSCLSAAGDAGMFRTPRHIIDFIVSIVEPTINDSILDPACGTAGFLISAYKYLEKKYGDKLDLTKLSKNIQGHDISPNMVQLALVNLYLHQFPEPHIFEYDTLTYDTKWGKKFDCIFANPPFMTPKGGIVPHNRFAITSNRSEVLFVDYIIEHLKKSGKAGIIVPDSIITKSGNTYKALRKMLIGNGLRAIISLPAGVFNPYSGVKTSILLIDKSFKSDNIVFAKISADGFDLGSQRMKNDSNDLPEIKKILINIKNQIIKKVKLSNTNSPLVWISSKKNISDGFDLQEDSFGGVLKAKYELVQIGNLIDTIKPKLKITKKQILREGRIPVIDQGQSFVSGYTDNNKALIKLNSPVIIFGDHTCSIKYVDFDFAQGADGIKILTVNSGVDIKYLYYYLKVLPIKSDGYKRHFTKLKKHKILLPPLNKQKAIVKELDIFHSKIEEADKLISEYEIKMTKVIESLSKK